MINRLFRGTLGKLARVGYAASLICLMASLALGAMPTAASPSSSNPDLPLLGPCTGDYSNETGNSLTTPNGELIASIVVKAGDECVSLPDACYEVTDGGVGEDHVTVNSTQEKLEDGTICHDVSHIEVTFQDPTPTNTPVPTNTATNTPTNAPGDPTNTPTNTSTDTPVDPTNTPTNTPVTPEPTNTFTHTPTNTATNTPVTPTNNPTATNTLEPGVTPTETLTPTNTATATATNTATNTPQGPALIDPKEDGLLTDNDGNGLPSPGDVLQYTVTIFNAGDTASTGVSFNDTPDPNTSLIVGTVTTTHGLVETGNDSGDTTIEVDIGTIAPGVTVTITFQVTIDAGLPSTVGQVENQGVVSGDNVPTSDTDDPDTQDPDDPTVSLLVHPTATPTPGEGEPGEPKPTEEDPPADSTPSTVLIPVTGVDRSVVTTSGLNLPAALQYLGLSLLGISLVIHGISFSRRRDD